jgi:lantibiotic biosynthesis dehydratase-like protein
MSVSDTVLLPGGGWRLWSQFALRGPGFPAAGILRLAPPGLGEAADKFRDDALSGAQWAGFEEKFGEVAVATAQTLQEIAALPAFRAAVAWQNRAVLRSGIAPFLSWEPTATGRTSMPRQREELVAHYWQRFCVKNDTIGFFGPVGWGRWDLTRRGIEMDPGDRLIAESQVYFSSWAIDALAKAIGADPGLRQWLPPRRVSFVRLSDAGVTLPGRPPQDLSPSLRPILELCDGTRQPGAIAEAVGQPAAEVLDALATLAQRRWIVWRIEVPASAHPDRALRATLERVPDPVARGRALAQLAVLEDGRERVRLAMGDADTLVAALTALEADFVGLTQTPAQREKSAKTAPCRALVYSDSRRRATARIGTAVLDELTPLTLCLTAARWMTNRFAEAVSERIRSEWRMLRDQQAVVDLASLWMRCLPVPHPQAAGDIDRIQAQLRSRWEQIIDAPAGARRVHRTSAAIADRVREAFGEPAAGWNIARYVSPDVFVLADDVQAVERGDFGLVLGELHVAMNTVGASLFVMQHPDARQLLAETGRDFPGPRVMPMLPKEQPPRWNTRSRPALMRPEDYHVGMVDYTADPHRPRTVMAADVAVEERDGRLVAVLPDGAVFSLLDVFGNALTNRVMDRFTLRSDADHSPRVTVDRMVVARETWRFTADELTFAAEKAEAKRFVRGRRWRDARELPRFVFVISPAEPRPFCVDFDSPVYVNILAKAARRLGRRDPAAQLTITEMLPTPEQAWLTDHSGARYSSELRFVAVDQTGQP